MRAPSSRTRRIVTFSAAPVAVLLAGAMVWQGSNAAFTAETRNIGNNWETGSVAISDDDGGAAMFQISNVVPGQTGQKCIVVSATPSVPSTVKLYSADLNSGGLQDYVKVTIEQGTGGSFNDCTGFASLDPAVVEASQTLTDLSAHGSWATAILPFTAQGGSTTSRTFKFNWVFDVGSLTQEQIDALQGHAASIDFEWELQNNAVN